MSQIKPLINETLSVCNQVNQIRFLQCWYILIFSLYTVIYINSCNNNNRFRVTYYDCIICIERYRGFVFLSPIINTEIVQYVSSKIKNPQTDKNGTPSADIRPVGQVSLATLVNQTNFNYTRNGRFTFCVINIHLRL